VGRHRFPEETNEEIGSCIYGTHACLRALLDIPEADRAPDERAAIERGLDYFLGRHLYQSRRTGRAKRLWYPYNEGWDRLGNPVIDQYDALSGLELLERADRLGDHRAAPALSLVAGKQGPDGLWRTEQSGRGMLPKRDAPPDEPSKWLTFRAMRIYRALGASDN
jgi:hypothetical protein